MRKRWWWWWEHTVAVIVLVSGYLVPLFIPKQLTNQDSGQDTMNAHTRAYAWEWGGFPCESNTYLRWYLWVWNTEGAGR